MSDVEDSLMDYFDFDGDGFIFCGQRGTSPIDSEIFMDFLPHGDQVPPDVIDDMYGLPLFSSDFSGMSRKVGIFLLP